MSKNRYKRKISVKKIIGIVLVGALLVGILSSFAVFAKNDTKSVNPIFEIGALDEATGQYVADNTAIYTKKAIECQGLKIKPDFDSNVLYQIFWYNEDEIYFGCTEKTTNPNTVFGGPVPECAKYCRIVIYPSQLDEDGKQIKDFKVSIFNIPKIVSNLEITVDKKQNFSQENLFEGLREVSASEIRETLFVGDKIFLSKHEFAEYVEDMADYTESETKSILCYQPDHVDVYKLDLTNAKSDVSGYLFSDDGKLIDSYEYRKGDVYYIDVSGVYGAALCLVMEDVVESCSLTVYLPR